MQSLGRAGVVQSRRGIGGGMTLVKAPAELTLLEVVGAVEPIKRIRTCPLGLAAHGARLCPLHERLDDALAMVEEAFRRDDPGRAPVPAEGEHTPVPIPRGSGEGRAMVGHCARTGAARRRRPCIVSWPAVSGSRAIRSRT